MSFLDQEHATSLEALPPRLGILAYCLVLDKHKIWPHKGTFGYNSSHSYVPIQNSLLGMSLSSSRSVEDALSPPILLSSFSSFHMFLFLDNVKIIQMFLCTLGMQSQLVPTAADNSTHAFSSLYIPNVVSG